MDPLATPDDISARLGRGLSIEEVVRVEMLLTDVSARVRQLASQTFDATTGDTVVVPVINGRARLPQRPVTALIAVTDTNGSGIAWTLVVDQVRVEDAVTEIVVTYDHGAGVPDAIRAVVCSVVCRALGVAPDRTGVQQEAIDGYSYTTGSAAAQGAIGLLDGEREVCLSYRRRTSTIAVG